MKTKREYKLALQAVQKVIHEWDPYELLKNGAPKDEFDSEIASIVSQVPRIRSSKDAASAVSRVFSSSFEPEQFEPKSCTEVGERLYKALDEQGLLK